MSDNDIYYLLVDTPMGRIPLIGATMTDEREREIAAQFPVKKEKDYDQ